MPPASGPVRTGHPAPATDDDDPVLLSERDHLRSSREYLRLMRDNVLSLRALGGDPVSEEYLKADLYRRAEALVDLPDTPLFFGRLDYAAGGEPADVAAGRTPLAADRGEPEEFRPEAVAGEQFHIGRRHVHDPDGRPVVIDWRAPVSRPFYRASPADPMGLALRRRFGFSGGELTAYEDEELAAGPPGGGLAPASGPPSRIMIEEIERP